ncbi:MAG TPA: type II toxin-antitoxin system RelE/ParE family toxin [Bryobacteraceae bacterium]|nr:type II toxin-antitoxin system RelE/ParE family toxin [Bryobacteraceae bacterium]
MAFRVEITARAKGNVDVILRWLLSRQAGDAARRWFQGLTDVVASLSNFPSRCSLAPESAVVPFKVRQLTYGRKPRVYRVPSTIENDAVIVHHTRHGRQKSLPVIDRS